MATLRLMEDPKDPGRVLRILDCDCGTRFEIYDWWSTPCPGCGVEYNGAGQKLAPRSQWGEETGETLADIEGPDRPDYLEGNVGRMRSGRGF